MTLVSARGLSRTYAAEISIEAVRGVDLDLVDADYVALTGPSGSGKSTLLNMIGLLDRPSTGSLMIDEIDVSNLGERARARIRAERIGFVFQGIHLIPHRTAVENVTLGLIYGPALPRIERELRSMRVLEAVGLGHRCDALPGQLSGGQKQRVAIARALVNQPDILLCDEPTGNLDSASTDSVLDLLDAIQASQEVTILIATHDPLVSERASSVVNLIDGRIVEDGI
jgi:putative ABC transport system ATP-binding protein